MVRAASLMSSYASYLLETFLTLILVGGVAALALYGARRLGLGRTSGPIALVGTLPLDGRRFIYLVRVGEQVFVVGVGEGGFTKLGEVGATELTGFAPSNDSLVSNPFVASPLVSRKGDLAGAAARAFGAVLTRTRTRAQQEAAPRPGGDIAATNRGPSDGEDRL